MPGLYLLGFLRLEGIKPDETLGVGRLLIASAFLIFALSLLPGMFGAPLGELDAYVPARVRRLGGQRRARRSGPKWMKNEYRGALARAKAENKTGAGQLHRLRLHQLPLDEGQHVPAAGDRRRRSKNFVLVELYTDGTDAASEENQKLQEGEVRHGRDPSLRDPRRRRKGRRQLRRFHQRFRDLLPEAVRRKAKCSYEIDFCPGSRAERRGGAVCGFLRPGDQQA